MNRVHLARFFNRVKKARFAAGDGRAAVDGWLLVHVGGALRRLGGYLPVFSCVATHEGADLDAVACASLGETPVFFPGNAAERPVLPDGVMILDHPLGLKGAASAFAHVLSLMGVHPLTGERNERMLRVMDEIDEADTAKTDGEGRFDLDEIVADDLDLREAYFGGEALVEKERSLFMEWEKKAVFHRCGEILFVELPDPRASSADFAIWLRTQHPSLAGCVYRDGNNLGIFRYPGRDEPRLEAASARLPGWYLDARGGWMLSWGTRKVPKTSPPPEGHPRTTGELVAFVAEG